MDETMSFLDTISLELSVFDNDKLENAVGSEELIGPGETVAGTLPKTLRKIWMIKEGYKRELAKGTLDLQFLPSHKRKDRLIPLIKLEQRMSVLESIFWLSVRDHFDLWNCSVGLRDGWSVVWYRSSGSSTLASLLGLPGDGGSV